MEYRNDLPLERGVSCTAGSWRRGKGGVVNVWLALVCGCVPGLQGYQKAFGRVMAGKAWVTHTSQVLSSPVLVQSLGASPARFSCPVVVISSSSPQGRGGVRGLCTMSCPAP